jgi:hypothetical protein
VHHEGAKGEIAPGGKIFKDGKKVDNIIIYLYFKKKIELNKYLLF